MQLLLFKVSSIFVSIMSSSLLGAINWGENENDLKSAHPWIETILEPILNLLNTLLLPIIIIIGTAGSIYAIVLGVNYSRAETSDKREEAKKRMINAIVGLIAMVFLLIILQLVVTNAPAIVETITGFGKGQ